MRDGWRDTTLGAITTKIVKSAPTQDFDYVDISSVSRDAKAITAPARTKAGDAPGRARQHLRTDDVLVSTVRPNLNAVARVPGELDGAVGSTGFAVLRASDEVHPGILFAVARSSKFVETMTERSTGSNYPAVTDKIVREFPVVLPPLDEQRRIVDLIAAVDDAVDAAEAEAVVSSTLVTSLLADYFPTGSPLDLAQLGTLATVTDCEHRTAPAAGSSDESYAYSIGTAAVRDGELSLDVAKPVTKITFESWTERRIPGAGDIILTREAPAGEVALIREHDPKLCLGQRTVLLSVTTGMPAEYLWLALQAPSTQDWIRSRSIGQTVSRVNVSQIKQIPVIQRSASEAAVICSTVEAAIAARQSARATADALRTLRSNLLTVLLSGEHEIPSSYDALLEEVE